SFFFQAEDGIRDYKVTGVQTCALPILVVVYEGFGQGHAEALDGPALHLPLDLERIDRLADVLGDDEVMQGHLAGVGVDLDPRERSEERRVGKECRSRWSEEADK